LTKEEDRMNGKRRVALIISLWSAPLEEVRLKKK
jgi:hypothetical protein